MTLEQRQIVRDMVWIGFWTTLITIPIGLFVLPRFHGRDTWKAAALLTAAGYATKSALLPH